MALDLETLVVQIQANTSDIDNKMRLLNASVNNALGAVEDRTKRLSNTLGTHFGSMSRLTRQLTAGFAIFQTLRIADNVVNQFDKIADTARSLGIAVDINLTESMRKARESWITEWTRMQLFLGSIIAPVLNDLAKLDAQIGKPMFPNASNTLGRKAEQPQAPVMDPKIIAELENNQLDAAKKLSLAQDQLISKMKLQAELAGETANQRAIDQKIIEAATKQLEIQNRSMTEIVSSVAQARAIVGPAFANRVSSIEVQTNAATSRAGFNERLAQAQSAANQPGPVAAFDPQKVHAEIARSIDEQQRVIILNNTRDAQQKQFLGDLKTEADIAALAPKQLEIEVELMRARDRFGADFVDKNKDVIASLVQQRQHMEDVAAINKIVVDGIANFGDTMQQAGGKFGKAVEFMIADIVRLIAKLEITKALESSLGGINILGSIEKFLGIGAGKAGGGDVYPGTVYPVGERGPELFMPRVPGVIVPNGTGAGSPSVVHVVIGASPEFDARMVRVSAGTATQVVAHYDRNTLPSRIGQLALDPYRK